MSKQEKMQTPSGMAGLVRYYDEDKSLIKLKPEHVVGMCVAIIALEAILFSMFPI